MTPSRTIGLATAVALIATTVAANYATTRYGFVSVGFGQVATAGTFAAGLALGLRDIVQDTLGRRAVLAVIVAGGGVSFLVAAPAIAVASAVAFLIAEAADFAIYTPMRGRAAMGGRRWAGAVAASNAVGAIVDTVIFLALAFGAAAVTVSALAGQLIGKGWATLAVIAVVGVVRALLRQPVVAVRA